MKRSFTAACYIFIYAAVFPNSVSVLPEEPVPGSVIVIKENDVSFLLGCTLFKDNVMVFDGFPVSDGNGNNYFLIPISHTADPGLYSLILYYGDGHQDMRMIEIHNRQFKTMEISLNKEMTDLRSISSREKQEESEELWALLGHNNTTIRYKQMLLHKPVKETRVTAFYGDRRTYLYDDNSLSKTFHNGIDYAVPEGTPVEAAESGIVVMAKERIITGKTIVIEHGPGIYTLYYHLSAIDAAVEDIVLKGEQIGLSGATGLATGPHLHFEMRVFQVPVDPEFYMYSISPQVSFD